MTTLYVGSNFHQTRRHYTHGFEGQRGTAGNVRSGDAICSGITEVYDQPSQDWMAKQWGFGHTAKQNSDLPVCALCQRKAAKYGWEVAA